MNHKRGGKFWPLLLLSVCLLIALMICGFVLDTLIGRTNDELWAKLVRWVVTLALVFGMVWAYDAWKPRNIE